jgi:excinuclease ABC subunit A
MKSIELKGVRQNNLKNIDIEIPLGSLVVICGPSGSGKSSLAFQTLFAEGQRRYLESLSNYARQFVGQAPKPLLDSAKNIPPSIALEQRNAIKSSRSTVGTHSEIYDFVRTLFARVGTPMCPNHHTEMKKFDASIATDEIYRLFHKKRLYLTCPLTVDSNTDFPLLKKKILEMGYFKAIEVDAGHNIIENFDLEFDELKNSKNFLHLIVDRLEVNEESELRVFDALSQAFELSKNLFGHAKSEVITTEQESLTFKPVISCSQCDEEFWDLSPDLFSFNNMAGACPSCRGFGNQLELDENKIVPNHNLSIKDGAIIPYEMPSASKQRTKMLAFCKSKKVDINKPWKDLSTTDKETVWRGSKKRDCIGGFFNYLETKKYKMHVRVFLSRFKSSSKCSTCKGFRLDPKINQVKIGAESIGDVCTYPLDLLSNWLKSVELNENKMELTKDLREQLQARLDFLNTIGLTYLSLSRETKTLSGGEFQRLNISNQLGSELSDTLYVLDEPTIGLHPRDNQKLISLLIKLHKNKNTVVLVEHDKEVIEAGEYIFEIGPESGVHGGNIVFSGTKQEFLKSKDSLTAAYITGRKQSFSVRKKEDLSKNSKIKISGCNGHNLQDVELEIPSERIVCVTGVSGSGKSSLISKTLYPAILKKLTGEHQPDSLHYKNLELPKGCKSIDFVDQQRVSKSKRSTVATYLKIFDHVRKLMSSIPESKYLGYTPGTFSLNTEGGRCPGCKGLGVEEVDMLFMDNIHLVCEICNGKKYTSDILKLKFQDKNIYEILELTCEEAVGFFSTQTSILKPLKVLKSLGLDYLKLGQTLDTLSGGESQRLKLSKYLLGSTLKGKILIFDEPSTGLHFKEISLLLEVFNQLVASGASVIIIEHNLDIIASSDYVVDIGPEAGSGGGIITAFGHPLDISKTSTYTGKYLKEHLK